MSALQRTLSPIRTPRVSGARLVLAIAVAVLVVLAAVMPVASAYDRTALVLGGSTVPTPDAAYIDAVQNHLVGPTHQNERITYIPVTTPMEFWPIAGVGRVFWLVAEPSTVWVPGGPGWPNEPLWKLSGLFDRTFDQSVRHGVVDLEDEMAKHPGEPLVIYGYSQGAVIANLERRKLAGEYTAETAPDIDFVLSGDPNTPNGGLAARFPGLAIPLVGFTFNGPAPTDAPFDTVVVNQEYEGVGDFPLYPLNLVALANSLLGVFYVHSLDLEVSLPDDPKTSPAYQGSDGRTDYYLFPTADLPLFGPLRTLGVPEPVIDVFEPFFRVLVDLGYDRSIPPWQPTPARLIPTVDPATVTADLVTAVAEGVDNASALVGSPPLRSNPATPETGRARVDVSVDVAGPVERNRADDGEGTVEATPTDVPARDQRKASGEARRTRSTEVSGEARWTRSTEVSGEVSGEARQTTSTEVSGRSEQTASTQTSSGTRQTARGDADQPSTHTADDASATTRAGSCPPDRHRPSDDRVPVR